MIEHWRNENIENIEGEIWKQISSYSGYYASNKGRIKRESYYFNYNCHGQNKPILKPTKICHLIIDIQTKRYNYKSLVVKVWLGVNKIKKVKLARLIALAFYGNNENMVVNHIDNNPYNNSLENLEYVSQRDNCNHYNISKSKLYLGVKAHKRNNIKKKFCTFLFFNKTHKNLGYFHNPKIAHAWYLYNLEIRGIKCKYL